MVTTGADVVVRTLIEQGCDTVFGYPGGNVINIYDALYQHEDEIRHVLTAHEQGAAHAADGYARATGRVGVCIATSGPGATNLVTGIATAFLDSVPLVAITGNVSTGQIGTDSFQELDITGVTLPITKHNFFVGSAKDVAPTIREAFRLAMSGRPGPVLIDFAKNAQTGRVEYAPEPPVTPDARTVAPDDAIAAAAECINQSRRPYVYFGGGMIASGAQAEMLALAEALDAPLGCSLMGISAIPTDTPRFLGMEGMHGHFASTTAMKNADCIIALGVRFNDRSTGDRAKFARGTRIVHIDVDESELSKTIRDTHDLCGDLRETLARILPLVRPRERGDWHREVDGFVARERAGADRRPGLTPRAVMGVLQRHLTPEMTVTTDVGQHQMWAAQYLSFDRPRSFVTSGGLGTMGFGLGASVGASLATGRRTALVTGDGSFGMSLVEMATAVTVRAPLVILLLNNGVLGMVRQQQRYICHQRYSNTTLERRTDFVALAKAFGADGERVADLGGLDAALGRAFAADGPYLVECPVGEDELVLPMMLPGGSMDDIIVRDPLTAGEADGRAPAAPAADARATEGEGE